MQCEKCGTSMSATARFCPSCGSPAGASSRGGTREVGGSKRLTWKVGLILFPLVLAAGIGLFAISLNPAVHPVIGDQPVVAPPADYDSTAVTMTTIAFHEEGGDIVFSLPDLLRHRLVRFEVRTPTTTRPVMAYLAPDGRLVTAISVSDHCGSTEFVLRNNQIECARCPSRWDMMTMEAFACCSRYYPDPIPSRVQGSEVRIPRAFVDRWAGRM